MFVYSDHRVSVLSLHLTLSNRRRNAFVQEQFRSSSGFSVRRGSNLFPEILNLLYNFGKCSCETGISSLHSDKHDIGSSYALSQNITLISPSYHRLHVPNGFLFWTLSTKLFMSFCSLSRHVSFIPNPLHSFRFYVKQTLTNTAEHNTSRQTRFLRSLLRYNWSPKTRHTCGMTRTKPLVRSIARRETQPQFTHTLLHPKPPTDN
jgi:hypothetical protein